MIMHTACPTAVGQTCAKCGTPISHQWFVGEENGAFWCADCTTNAFANKKLTCCAYCGAWAPDNLAGAPKRADGSPEFCAACAKHYADKTPPVRLSKGETWESIDGEWRVVTREERIEQKLDKLLHSRKENK